MAAIKPRNRRLRRTLLALIFSGAYSSSTNLPTAPSLDLGGAAAAGFDLSAGMNFDAMKEWAHQYIIDAYQSTPFCSWRLVSNTVRQLLLYHKDAVPRHKCPPMLCAVGEPSKLRADSRCACGTLTLRRAECVAS